MDFPMQSSDFDDFSVLMRTLPSNMSILGCETSESRMEGTLTKKLRTESIVVTAASSPITMICTSRSGFWQATLPCKLCN